MRNNPPETAEWDWLADPNAALELYSIERRAFFNWQTVEQEWSKATSHLDTRDSGQLTEAQRHALDQLRGRLDEAAREYERARQRLHQAWSA